MYLNGWNRSSAGVSEAAGVAMFLLFLAIAADAADGPARAPSVSGPVRFRREVPAETFDQRAEALGLEAIARLEALLRTEGLPGETRAELLLRLGELVANQSRRLRLREMEATGTPSPAGSIAWQDRAIAIWRAILRDHPRQARADEAALALGWALDEAGRFAESDEALKVLLRSYPESDALPEAYLLLGEHAFDAGNVYAALKAYQKASAFTGHPKAAYALYKLGWCQYNVGEYDAAIDSLRRVVAQGLAVPEDDTTTLRMHDEALADLVRFFADADRVDDAVAYFDGLGRHDLARRAMTRLADLLVEQGRTDAAVAALKRLQLDDPAAPEAADLQVRIVKALAAADRRQGVLDELERLLATAGPTDTAGELLRRQATVWHDLGNKHVRGGAADGPELHALADRAYARWLATFSARPEAVDVHYAYGELLYALGRYREAHAHYVTVVEADPQGQHARFCAEAAMFAAEKLVGQIERPVALARATEPLDLTADERLLVDACDRLAAMGSGPKVRDALYKAGYLLYHRHRFEEAAPRFRTVIALDPRSREAEYAAHLILSALELEESWDALATTAAAFAGEERLGTAAFRAEVHGIAVNASFRRIEAAYERDRDAALAGEGFEAFAAAFPDEPLAGRALHDAAVRYGQAGRHADALRVRTVVIDDPRFGPKSKWYAEDLRELGFGLERIADFAGAAERYEALWRLPDRGDEAAARDAIWSAAVFRHALGDDARAAADYRAFAAAAGDDPRVADARFRAGKLARDAEGLLAVADDRGVPRELALAAAWEAGTLLPPSERDRLYARFAETEPAEGPERRWVARMRAALAEPLLARYRALAITGTDDATIQRTLGLKVRAFNQAETAVEAVIAAGDAEEGLTALVTLGEAYRDLAEALAASPTPERLKEEQRVIYRRGIDDTVWTLEGKAVDAYALAVERGAELQLYGEPMADAVRALGLLRPEDHGGLPEEMPRAPFLATTARTADALETTLE